MPGFGAARKRVIRSSLTFGSWRTPCAMRPASADSDVGHRFFLATIDSVTLATGMIRELHRRVQLLPNGRRGSLRIRPQSNNNAARGHSYHSVLKKASAHPLRTFVRLQRLPSPHAPDAADDVARRARLCARKLRLPVDRIALLARFGRSVCEPGRAAAVHMRPCKGGATTDATRRRQFHAAMAAAGHLCSGGRLPDAPPVEFLSEAPTL